MRQEVRAGEPLIEAQSLRKRYGSTVAVDSVDLTVFAGEIFGILGPNGAGKTTTLEMMEGLRTPDAGTIHLAGFDTATHIAEIRPLIGVQLQTTALFDHLTASEIIELFASLYGVANPADRAGQLLSIVKLEDKRNAKVHQLSGGQQQRLSIALGLVNDPVVAFLDEPTTGLDPGARRDLWQTIRDIREAGTTVVLTTHYMDEAETLCDRVAIMDFGRVIALDTPAALIRGLESAATIMASIASGEVEPAALAQLPAATDIGVQNGQIEIQTTDVQRTLVALLDLAARSGVQLADLRSTHSTLEDVFLALTGREFEPATEVTGEENGAPTGLTRRIRRR